MSHDYRKSKLARKQKGCTIPVSPFETLRWRPLEDSNVHAIMRPTISECGPSEILQHKVVSLTTQLGDEIDILEQRIRRLEHLAGQERTGCRKTSFSSSYKTLSEIHSAREDWCTLLGGQGAGLELTPRTTLAASAIIRNDIPSCSFGPHEEEEDQEGPKPVKPRQPTCSKLYCTNLTVNFKNGKFRKQCDHCIALSKKSSDNNKRKADQGNAK